VDSKLNIVSVCALFGWHVKFIVSVHKVGKSSSKTVTVQNLFYHDVLSVVFVHQQFQNQFQSIIRIYNDLLTLAGQKGLKLPHNDVESGKRYFMTLTSTLWFIDGHYTSLADRGYKIPELFNTFQGYNVPELSRHKKRQRTDLSSEKLSSLVNLLYDHLMVAWLNTSQWSAFHHATEVLASNLNSYLQYLKVNLLK